MHMGLINLSEDFTKYIFNKSQFSSLNKRVKYSVFMPSSNRRLSVFRISGISVQEVWKIGETVGSQRASSLLARADIKATAVIDIGLEIDADDIPPRHANIVGWPDEDSEIKLRAVELAEKAQLHLK